MKKNLLTIFVIPVLLLIQFLFVGKAAAFGDTVSQLEDKIYTLKQENQEIEKKIAQISSCSAILQDKDNEELLRVLAELENSKEEDLKVALKP